jgi:Baculovirus FP protein
MTSKAPTCVKCKANITSIRKPGFNCNNCKKVYIHSSCAKVSEETFSDIAAGKASWSCAVCKQKERRQSQVFPPNATLVPQQSSSSTLAVESTENQLQNLIVAFNEYKRETDERILQLQSLAASVEKVEIKAGKIEQISIERSLEIQGIPETDLGDPQKAALDLAIDIGCPVAAQEIECEIDRSSTTPTLVVNFRSKNTRRNFLHAGKRFNREKKRITRHNRSHKIFVNEKLTIEQKRLLYNTKSFAREFEYNFAWFCNGKVHLKKSELSLLIIVSTQQRLEELRQDELERVLPERSWSPFKNERDLPSDQEQ